MSYSSIKDQLTSLTRCCLFKFKMGGSLGLTEYHNNIYLDDLLYHSGAVLSTSAVELDDSLSADNFEISGALTSDFISQEDLLAGKYDYCYIELFMVDYNDKSLRYRLSSGHIGKISIKDGAFKAEVNSVAASADNSIIEIFSPTCRASFCDERCKLNSDEFSSIGKITEIIDDRSFVDVSCKRPFGYYEYGKIKFDSGRNKGFVLDVRNNIDNRLFLCVSSPYEMKIGDKYTITAGCDKLFKTCKNKFNNAKNFRGEPHIPNVKLTIN